MTQYQISMDFDGLGLDFLDQSQQHVTMVKSSAGAPVAWVSFKPMLKNIVTWTEDYSIYASTTNFLDGTEIVTQSVTPAVGGKRYQLKGGRFVGGTAGLPLNEYGMTNADPGCTIGDHMMVTSGLYQGVMVNGNPLAGAINAVTVGYQEDATFTPVEKVDVFVSERQSNGLVISFVQSKVLEVNLTEVTSQALRYDATVNRFTLA